VKNKLFSVLSKKREVASTGISFDELAIVSVFPV
jgi:hypothetical protein